MRGIARQLALLLAGCLLSLPGFANIEVQSWQTSQGAKVMFVEAPELPILDVRVTFDAGSARDGEKWGLASMTAAMIGSATAERDENRISDDFNRLGAVFSQQASRDSAAFSLRSLSRSQIREQALTQFADVLGRARFDEQILQRERARWLAMLKQKESRPQVLASDLLWTTLYGKHPYAHSSDGSQQTVSSIKRGDLEAFYQKYYTAGNAVIALVGSLRREQAEAVAERLAKALRQGEKASPLPPVAEVKHSQTLLREFPSAQTYILNAQKGIRRGDADYVALFVANEAFGGGGFGSYLMQEVREERGLAYSVYSYFAPMKLEGPFTIGLSTKNASAKQAQEVLDNSLHTFVTTLNEARLQEIKDNLIGGFPLRVDSNAKLVSYISMIGFYNLPLDYLQWFPEQVAKLTLDQVIDAWKRRIGKSPMVRVMVGTPG
ncbi:pitrilysin family protein [Thiomicrorhabdus sp.]|uniref:M16 family metallopeptidase n=1 Tax=Thiomicrorhabdus sp. TaxID=2039724 RepID=UPI0029C91835|nr:pitrilysin family protein [Thiomicrorhabdus sp.]